MKPHKHAEVIKAWAEGAEIEWRLNDKDFWETVSTDPKWDVTRQYRVKDPYRELKEAQAAGKVIQGWLGEWRDQPHPIWNAPPDAYRIKPEPATKKVKLLAYLDVAGELRWIPDTKRMGHPWKRVPSEDKEIEYEV